jgi:hypothetical protein
VAGTCRTIRRLNAASLQWIAVDARASACLVKLLKSCTDLADVSQSAVLVRPTFDQAFARKWLKDSVFARPVDTLGAVAGDESVLEAAFPAATGASAVRFSESGMLRAVARSCEVDASAALEAASAPAPIMRFAQVQFSLSRFTKQVEQEISDITEQVEALRRKLQRAMPAPAGRAEPMAEPPAAATGAFIAALAAAPIDGPPLLEAAAPPAEPCVSRLDALIAGQPFRRMTVQVVSVSSRHKSGGEAVSYQITAAAHGGSIELLYSAAASTSLAGVPLSAVLTAGVVVEVDGTTAAQDGVLFGYVADLRRGAWKSDEEHTGYEDRIASHPQRVSAVRRSYGTPRLRRGALRCNHGTGRCNAARDVATQRVALQRGAGCCTAARYVGTRHITLQRGALRCDAARGVATQAACCCAGRRSCSCGRSRASGPGFASRSAPRQALSTL